jgi:hypothetical protein
MQKNMQSFKKDVRKNTKNSLGFKKFRRGEDRLELLKRWQQMELVFKRKMDVTAACAITSKGEF